MNLLKSSLKRTTALATGVFVGLIGAVALTSPASAHSPVIKGEAHCLTDGKWKVDWTVANDYNRWAFVREITTTVDGRPGLKPTGDIKLIAAVAPNYRNPLEGTSVLQASKTTINLKVSLKWTDDFIADADYTVTKPETCTPGGEPSTPASEEPSTPASEEPSTPASEEPSTPASEEPSTPASEEPSTPASDEPSTPASEEPSTPPTDEPTPGPTPSYGEAEPIFDVTCDSMTIGLDNPEDGVEVPLVLEPSAGDKVVLDVKAGEKKSHTFKASDGFKVKIYLQGYESESETIAWQAPDGCNTGGAGGGDDEPSLPLTGAAAGSIAAGAGVLLAAGLTLFFIARRRKVKFTA
ncbi:LPXTG cell wall anchor domain-containing protein [Actinoplanes sp. N902-109]|uniref:LPXTG cell wall anchor domain-containing protein n=1 Tax=Actinoplanes sp. (strain N902-109) TaxID=649831 RepID=UPI000329617E|nr:LPXTG cell wall anchor domain-containing protein [Actinoplanes sp. N902-109]AGL20422.1 cell wall anchor domain-containing protein [Actinoplanes sp. N902-109]